MGRARDIAKTFGEILIWVGVIVGIFALLGWTAYFSHLGKSSSKFYYIVAFIPLALLLVAHVVVMLRPTIQYPGREIPKKHSPVNQVSTKLNTLPLPYISEEARVGFITEKVSSDLIADHHWRMHLYFLVHNSHTQKVVLTDMHANLYYETPILQKGVVGRREEIVLYETNSILAGAKVYEITAGGTLPVDLILEVSRCVSYGDDEGTTVSGPISTVFGIFIDYFLAEHKDSYTRFRVPSDSVFIFENSAEGNLGYINKKNFEKFRRANEGSKRLITLLKECLDKHTSQYYEIA